MLSNDSGILTCDHSATVVERTTNGFDKNHFQKNQWREHLDQIARVDDRKALSNLADRLVHNRKTYILLNRLKLIN